MSDRQHTKFVTGGIYRRTQGGEEVIGTLIGGKQLGGGMRIGNMITASYSPEKVIETKALDDWELLAVPVPVEQYEKIQKLLAVGDALLSLLEEMPRARLLARQARAAATTPHPALAPPVPQTAQDTFPPISEPAEEDEDEVEELQDEQLEAAETEAVTPAPPQSEMAALRGRRRQGV